MKIHLNFMVDPVALQEQAVVLKPVKLKIIKPDHDDLSDYLGQSGKLLAKAGIPFYFTEDIARDLIMDGIAEQI